MIQIRGRRIGSAHVIAVVALVLAVTGTAVALPGSNKIDKNDIKKNAVNSSDIKNNTVSSKDLKNNNATGADVKNGSLAGVDVKDGSLGGADIDEASLGQVPSAGSANTANTAARTSQIVNIFAAGPEGAQQTLLNLGGLTLTNKCESSNEIEATTSVSNSFIDVVTAQDNDYEFDEDFDVGETFDADEGHSQGFTEMYTIQYTRPDGVNVVITLHDVDAEETAPAFPSSPQQAECVVAGIATVAP